MKKFSKTVGNDLENQVKKLLEHSKIPYVQEHTVNIKGTRTKGSVDFILKNPVGYIECKCFTKRISFKLKSEIHDIKWSQVEFLYKKHLEGCFSGFIFKEHTDNRLIFVHVSDFIFHWTNTLAKSFNLREVLNMGIVVTDFDFINRGNYEK